MPLFVTSSSAIEGDAARELELDGRDLVIGRSGDADLTLPDPTQQVSSRHCSLAFRAGAYVLTDLSTNGTTLNGVRVAGPQPIKAGDRIGVGHYTLTVDHRAAPASPSNARMDLNSWGRGAAPTAPPSRPVSAPPTAPLGAREESLARGLAMLVGTRARQRRELGVTTPDPLAGNPLAAEPDRASALLAAATAPEQAIAAAIEGVERHHAATLQAIRTAFRATLDQFTPETIRRAVPASASGEDAALWRAYVERFTGAEAVDRGFVETFAREFRQAHERLTAASPSSGPRRPA